MKITKVEILTNSNPIELPIPWRPAWSEPSGPHTNSFNLSLYKVYTDQGIVGYGPNIGGSPELIKNQDPLKATYEEGCLSVPNQFAEIDRPSKCEVEYLDYNGKKQLLKADGLLATCIQHEMDHLEGILFIDYLSKLKKSMIIKKLSKLKSNTAEV